METNILRNYETVRAQEKSLLLPSFSKAAAWELGNRLKAACEKNSVAITIEIRIGKETVFLYSMAETGSENADWARRKRNLVELVERSSYRVGLADQLADTLLMNEMGLSSRDYCTSGGSFPIKVKGVGFVGVVTVSGLTELEDHVLVVQTLADMYDIDISAY